MGFLLAKPVANLVGGRETCDRVVLAVASLGYQHSHELAQGSAKASERSNEWICQVEGEYEAYMTCFPTLAVVQLHPIIDTVVLFTCGLEYFRKEFPEKVIVWVLFKT